MKRRYLYFLLIVFVVAAAVRVLTFNFLSERLNDPAWFQYGTYQVFEERTIAILDGTEPVFWAADATRTDVAFFPPGYTWMLAAMYSIGGVRSITLVQNIQSVLDLLLSFVMITGLAVTSYGWRAGIGASAFVALSPLLAYLGVSPLVDSPTAWLVVAGIWLFVYAAKHDSWPLALGAGMVLGCACWLRLNPLYLTAFLAGSLLVGRQVSIRSRLILGVVLFAGTLLVVSPLLVRNTLVFREFTVGSGLGVNLWEGLGETEFGRSHGFEFGDANLIERDRKEMGLPDDFPMTSTWPDGIQRDRRRRDEALHFIVQHPIWYSGVVLNRMLGLVKVAGDPHPYSGFAGINVTRQKSLSPEWHTGPVAWMVDGLGMLQSVSRYLLLPLVGLGLWVAFRREWSATCILAAAILYYLVTGSLVHSEIRFALPMHWLLIVFAGVGISRLYEVLSPSHKTE